MESGVHPFHAAQRSEEVGVLETRSPGRVTVVPTGRDKQNTHQAGTAEGCTAPISSAGVVAPFASLARRSSTARSACDARLAVAAPVAPKRRMSTAFRTTLP